MSNPSTPDPLQPPEQPGASPTPERPDTPAKESPAGEPSVYGGQWGDSGQQKPSGPPPPDRPDKIRPPAEKN